MDHLQGLRAAVAELQAEVRRQRDEILLLRSIKPKPKSSLPDPEKFSGQPHKFDTWLPSIKAKLRVDGEAIGDTVAQFYYVYLNLESHIQAMVLPQLHQAEESQVWDYTTIFDQLIRVYDNPNKVQEAEDKLLALKQGTDSIPAYVAKFERVLYEARGQNWPDVNKISTFRNGLNSIIRSRLAQQLNLPRKYPDFVRVVQQLAGRTSQAPTSGNSNGSGPGNHNHHHGEPMEIGSINAIHVSSSPQRARSISPTLRGQYRLQGRCVRCGSYDHWVQSCPLQPYASGEGMTSEDNDSVGSSTSLGSDNRRVGRRKQVGI
jgi:Retrotransposon gag protein